MGASHSLAHAGRSVQALDQRCATHERARALGIPCRAAQLFKVAPAYRGIPLLQRFLVVDGLRLGVIDRHLAALPVPYRTTPEQPTFQSLRDPENGEKSFPTALDPYQCTRYDVAEFTRRARELGVDYVGLCCGADPHHVRSLAEAAGLPFVDFKGGRP